MLDVVLKRFDQPDETRTFSKGRLEIVRLGELTLGRASYEPGWKWSVDVRPLAGTPSCQVEHVGIVLAGRAAVAMDDGQVFEMGPGDVFHIAAGHDSWVLGDEPYVSLHLVGTESYGRG